MNGKYLFFWFFQISRDYCLLEPVSAGHCVSVYNIFACECGFNLMCFKDTSAHTHIHNNIFGMNFTRSFYCLLLFSEIHLCARGASLSTRTLIVCSCSLGVFHGLYNSGSNLYKHIYLLNSFAFVVHARNVKSWQKMFFHLLKTNEQDTREREKSSSILYKINENEWQEEKLIKQRGLDLQKSSPSENERRSLDEWLQRSNTHRGRKKGTQKEWEKDNSSWLRIKM